MSNLLAILVLVPTFHMAVETRAGIAERSFPNTRIGVSQFEEHIDLVIMKEGKNVKICLAGADEYAGEILSWLQLNDMMPALLPMKTLHDYAAKNRLAPNSPTTVLRACDAAFPKLREQE